MKKKLLFIDRDGTIITEPPITFQVDSMDKLSFLPGVIRNLYRITTEMNYDLIMATNQDGLGTVSFPEEKFNAVHNKMLEILRGEGIEFNAIHIDRSFASENKDTRKPGIGMLSAYFDDKYDLQNSFVIGDRKTDVQLAANLGTGSIFIKNFDDPNELTNDITLVADNWDDIYKYLRANSRNYQHNRTTTETNINVTINPDGLGNYKIDTGLGFFNHMLEQVAKHSGMDIEIIVKGDLHIDEHHTIEDTAIAFGEALLCALGNKRGIERFGFCLPMDDCLAQVAIDMGGRGWLEWEVEFKREFIGDVPTEMFYHFFRSFSDAAKCNINIKAQGTNEHHKIESIFKAFARALRMAIKQDVCNMILPTTKGVL